MKTSMLFPVLILAPFIATGASAQTQARAPASEILQCQEPKSGDIRFKVVQASSSIGDPQITGVRIVVDNKYYTEDKMRSLAELINKVFCHENRVSVSIFDEKWTAQQATVISDYLTNVKTLPGLRGFYSSNRDLGLKELSFSKSRGESPESTTLKF